MNDKNKARADRVEAMRVMYEGGAGLREVGAAFGITSQRVQQLFVQYGVERRSPGSGPMNAPDESKENIVRDYLAGSSRREVAATYGVSRRAVRDLLRERVSDTEITVRNQERATQRPGVRKWTDWELIHALQACARDLGTATFGVKRYSTWREGHETEYPSAALFHRRSPQAAPGSSGWNEWRRIAGLPVRDRPERLGRTTFSDDEMYGALAEVTERIGRFPSLREYDKNRSAGQPTAGAIRYRHDGRWGAVREGFEVWKGVVV